jgi:molecular chaperone DnaJ
LPTLTRSVTVKVPAGSRSGRSLRVRGRGVPAKSGTGDLIVTLEVAVPTDPSPEELEALGALAAVSDGEALRARLHKEV